MRIRIVEHRSSETGAFLCYEAQYKKFWWSAWRSFNVFTLLKSRDEMEQDILASLSIKGVFKTKKEFH